MKPDDLPVFDEAPVRSLEVPARAIRPRRAWPAVALVAAIAGGIVLAGFANRALVHDQARVVPVGPSLASTPAPTDPGGLTSFATGLGQASPVRVLDLASPGPGSVVVTSNRLTVAGHVLVRASRVEIVLAATGNRLYGQASADVSDRGGGIRPASEPAFEVQFDLSGTPRPIGTMQVVVTAYDTSGNPIGGMRRAISIAPLASG
jgi:hypothetical protein